MTFPKCIHYYASRFKSYAIKIRVIKFWGGSSTVLIQEKNLKATMIRVGFVDSFYFSYPATNLLFSFTLPCNSSAFCGKLTAEYLLSTNEPTRALSNLLLKNGSFSDT